MAKVFTKIDAYNLARQLNIDLNKIGIEEFTIGLNVELEHGLRDSETNVTNDDPVMTAKIAWAHLKEVPNYYTLLKLHVEGDNEDG